jgi:antitoxin (DNA-binding transcriptional repressor) of toxin-antitoxin stability system
MAIILDAASFLIFGKMSVMVPDMKKVNARAFQKAFSKVAQNLGQGETVQVTRHGKPFGFFTKAPERTPERMPDFAANLSNIPFIGPVGDQMIAKALDESLF